MSIPDLLMTEGQAELRDRFAELLALGRLEEAPLRREDLEEADEIWLINSLRNRIPVVLVDDLRPGRNLAFWRNTAL